MASKRTRKEGHENSWLDDIDKLEIQSKKMRKDSTKMNTNHGKPHQESQAKKNRSSKAKEKWSFVENDNVGGKKPASGKERKTWNSRCGTDIGVFEQVTNYRGKRVRNSTAIAMTDGNANVKRNTTQKNFETNVQTATNTYNSMEQETVVSNIQWENPDYDQEEEIEIIKEIAAKTPATTMGIKQEIPDYDLEEEIQIVKEIAAKTPATIKQEKSIYQPKVVITYVSKNTEKESQSRPGNEEIRASKETMISTPTDKYPAETTVFPSNTQLPQNPTHNKTWQSLHFTRSGLTITPVGPSTDNSFSTCSEARETSRGIHYGATRLPINNGSGGINGTTTPPNNSSVNNGLFQDGTTPVGPSATNYFSVGSEADTGRILDGATTGRILDGATTGHILDGATTGHILDGATTGHILDGATISQNKSPISNEREDNTGRARDGDRASPSKSPVNNRSGDMTGDTQDKTANSQSNSPTNDRSNTPVNGSGDITGRAQDETRASPVNNRSGDMTRYTQDKTATSQSNSPANDRSNTPVNGSGDITGRCHDGARASPSKSPANNRSNTPINGPTASPANNRRGNIRGHLDEATTSQGNSSGNNEGRNTTDQGTRNITITIGGGDLTLNNGGLNAQMKINDVCMKGPANDVANFVKEATRAVRDLVK